MISHRRLFGLLAGAAAAPALKPLMFLAPEETVVDILKWTPMTTYGVGDCLTASGIRRCVASLQGANNLRPLPNSNYSAFIHPDFVNLETGEIYDYPQRRTV